MRGLVFCFLASFALSACTTGKIDSTVNIEQLIPIDTVTIPFKTSQYWNQYYHPVFKKNILTFIEENPLQIVSVDPETLESITFPLDKIESEYRNLSHPLSFYVMDSNFAVVNYLNDKFHFFKIDRHGTIFGRISVIDKRLVKDYDLYLLADLLPIDYNDKEVNLCVNFQADIEGISDWVTNRSVRNKMFSAKTNLLLEFSDSLISVVDEIGSYPDKLQNLDGYYNLIPDFCLSPSGEIVNIFPSINYISITNVSGKTTFYKLSKKEIPDAPPMTTNNLFDYNYLSKYSYENSFLQYIISDKQACSYYIISNVRDKYENADGTVNDPVHSPWILIKLNCQFKITNSILFPKDKYSKHNVFFSSEFMYLLDNDLTKQNGKFTFVKFKKNWYE